MWTVFRQGKVLVFIHIFYLKWGGGECGKGRKEEGKRL
jgi:hypothetical protein